MVKNAANSGNAYTREHAQGNPEPSLVLNEEGVTTRPPGRSSKRSEVQRTRPERSEGEEIVSSADESGSCLRANSAVAPRWEDHRHHQDYLHVIGYCTCNVSRIAILYEPFRNGGLYEDGDRDGKGIRGWAD